MTLNNTPLVTIGVTTYNAESTVERAIRSALNQKWRPIEVIIVDDCSSDGTWTMLTRMVSRQSEIRVFSTRANGGVAAARNLILARATGEFLAFFDDDDESAPERVESQVERIVNYEKQFAGGAPVICHTARRQIYPDGSVEHAPTMGQRTDIPGPSGMRMAEWILTGRRIPGENGACATCSQMARLSTYRALGGFDADFRRSEDTEFNVRLARAGGHFIGIAEPLVTQTMTQKSDKQLDKEKRYSLQLLEKHRDLLDAAGLYDYSRSWTEHKYNWLHGHRVAPVLGIAKLMLHHPILSAQRIANFNRNAGYNSALRRFYKHADNVS